MINRRYPRNKSKVSPWYLFIIALVPRNIPAATRNRYPYYNVSRSRPLLGIITPNYSFSASPRNCHPSPLLFVTGLHWLGFYWKPAGGAGGSKSLTRNVFYTLKYGPGLGKAQSFVLGNLREQCACARCVTRHWLTHATIIAQIMVIT